MYNLIGVCTYIFKLSPNTDLKKFLNFLITRNDLFWSYKITRKLSYLFVTLQKEIGAGEETLYVLVNWLLQNE